MDSEPEKLQHQVIEVESNHSDRSEIGQISNKSRIKSIRKQQQVHDMNLDKVEQKIEEQIEEQKLEEIKEQIKKDLANIENPEELQLDFTKVIKQNKLLIETNYKEIISFNLKIEDDQQLFLKSHFIQRWQWTQTIEWISEIFSYTKANFSTFFYTVTYLNKYLSTTSKKIYNDELQKIAVKCMYLASQYNDVSRGVPNEILLRAFCHVTLKEIQEFSTIFLENIGFKLSFPHSFVFLTLALNGFTEIEGISEQTLLLLIEQSYFLLRLAQTRYNIISQYKSSKIAGGVLAYVIYLISLKEPKFPKLKCYKILEQLLKFRTPEVYSETYSIMINETFDDLESRDSTLLKQFPTQLDQYKMLKGL